jgi:hypothetical protein
LLLFVVWSIVFVYWFVAFEVCVASCRMTDCTLPHKNALCFVEILYIFNNSFASQTKNLEAWVCFYFAPLHLKVFYFAPLLFIFSY